MAIEPISKVVNDNLLPHFGLFLCRNCGTWRNHAPYFTQKTALNWDCSFSAQTFEISSSVSQQFINIALAT